MNTALAAMLNTSAYYDDHESIRYHQEIVRLYQVARDEYNKIADDLKNGNY